MIETAIALLSLALALASVYFVGKFNKKKGILGVDINKGDKRKLPESTGIALLAPIWIGIALIQLWHGLNIDLLAFCTMITAFSLVGFIDDRKHKFAGKTIPWKVRAAIIAIIACAFSLIFASNIYYFVLFALFVIALVSFQNTFAGLNGWEVGSGFIISVFVSMLLMNSSVFLPSIVVSSAIFGLLVFNVFPAKVFPGDSGTLLMGASISGLVVLNGDISLVFLVTLFFLPHIIDFFFLKMLTNPRDASQSRALPYKLLQDNGLDVPVVEGRKRLDFAKLVMLVFGPLRERQIVLIIWATVVLNCLFWLAFFPR